MRQGGGLDPAGSCGCSPSRVCMPWRHPELSVTVPRGGGRPGPAGTRLEGESSVGRCRWARNRGRPVTRCRAIQLDTARQADAIHLTAHRTLYDMQYRYNPDPKRLTAGVRLKLGRPSDGRRVRTVDVQDRTRKIQKRRAKSKYQRPSRLRFPIVHRGPGRDRASGAALAHAPIRVGRRGAPRPARARRKPRLCGENGGLPKHRP